jgi:hypothetical protein
MPMAALAITRAMETRPGQKVMPSPLPETTTRRSGSVAARLPLFLQPKLSVSQPGDPHEQEADRVADQIMRMPGPTVQRQCASCAGGGASCPACEEEEPVMVSRMAEGAAAGSVPALIVSRPSDLFELEPDRMADRVMRVETAPEARPSAPMLIQRIPAVLTASDSAGETSDAEGSRCPSWRNDPQSLSKRAAETYVRHDMAPPSQSQVERIECEPPHPNGNYGCFVHFSDGLVIRVIVREKDIVVGTAPIHTMTPPPATPLCFYDYACPDGELVLTVKECKRAKATGAGGTSMISRRSAAPDAPAAEAMPRVSRVLATPGRPLDPATRSFFEPRFQRDFSDVRVHTDPEAQQSARDVHALAYTVGSHIVFDAGRYAPQSLDGTRLLGHELAHTLQQRPGAKAVARTVDPAATNCVAGTNGATAQPIGQLEWLEAMAASKAYLTSASLVGEVAMAHIGTRGPGGRTTQAYLTRFGLPPARRGGFLDRLTGRVQTTQENALDAEMTSLSSRYQRIGDYLANRHIAYRCIEGRVTYRNCRTGCHVGEASACSGVNAIFLCAAFWQRDPGERTIMLIHEVAHILWANVNHVANFRHAECYASFVGDLFSGTGAGPACPTP